MWEIEGKRMRLIDGDRLYETLYEIRMDEIAKYGRNDTKHCCSLSTALYEIYNAPTIDPVKHGRWILDDEYDDLWRCSECGYEFVTEGTDIPTYFYCPNCGARIDEVEK